MADATEELEQRMGFGDIFSQALQASNQGRASTASALEQQIEAANKPDDDEDYTRLIQDAALQIAPLIVGYALAKEKGGVIGYEAGQKASGKYNAQLDLEANRERKIAADKAGVLEGELDRTSDFRNNLILKGVDIEGRNEAAELASQRALGLKRLELEQKSGQEAAKAEKKRIEEEEKNRLSTGDGSRLDVLMKQVEERIPPRLQKHVAEKEIPNAEKAMRAREAIENVYDNFIKMGSTKFLATIPGTTEAKKIKTMNGELANALAAGIKGNPSVDEVKRQIVPFLINPITDGPERARVAKEQITNFLESKREPTPYLDSAGIDVGLIFKGVDQARENEAKQAAIEGAISQAGGLPVPQGAAQSEPLSVRSRQQELADEKSRLLAERERLRNG